MFRLVFVNLHRFNTCSCFRQQRHNRQLCLVLVGPRGDECGNFVVSVVCERAAAAEQLLIIRPLCVSVREVVSALQRGRGPAQSHSQVLLPRLAGLETLRAHAEVRRLHQAPEKPQCKQTSIARFSALSFCCRVGFFPHFKAGKHLAAATSMKSSSLYASAAVGRGPITVPPTLIISVSADLIKRLRGFFAFYDCSLLSSRS